MGREIGGGVGWNACGSDFPPRCSPNRRGSDLPNLIADVTGICVAHELAEAFSLEK
jgi:hypothetical protein